METMYQKAFRHVRAHQSLSREQLARRLGISRQFVWRIEKGQKVPGIETLKKMEQLTGLSIFALAKGDFDNQKAGQYVKISNLNSNPMPIRFDEINSADRAYLVKKFEVEIDEIREEISEAKSRLAKRIEKSTLSEGELSILEAEVQKAQSNLDYLTSNNAPADMIADQQARVAKAEADLADKRRKGGIISDREAILEEVTIEELELRIQLRQEKITAIQAVG